VEEVNVVAKAFPPTALLPQTPENEPHDTSHGLTAQALLAKLPEANILHLACHGQQNGANPLKSGFVMCDEMLTIEQLMPVPLPRAFLAFLSACETAKGDKASD
jgi:CHAT domain-containing protein